MFHVEHQVHNFFLVTQFLGEASCRDVSDPSGPSKARQAAFTDTLRDENVPEACTLGDLALGVANKTTVPRGTFHKWH